MQVQAGVRSALGISPATYDKMRANDELGDEVWAGCDSPDSAPDLADLGVRHDDPRGDEDDMWWWRTKESAKLQGSMIGRTCYTQIWGGCPVTKVNVASDEIAAAEEVHTRVRCWVEAA